MVQARQFIGEGHLLVMLIKVGFLANYGGTAEERSFVPNFIKVRDEGLYFLKS